MLDLQRFARKSRQVHRYPDPDTGLRPIFPNRKGGWRSVDTLNADLRKALRHSEVEGVTPKDFRAMIATATAGLQDDQTAAGLLGHARVSVTGRHYIKDDAVIHNGVGVYRSFMSGAKPETED